MIFMQKKLFMWITVPLFLSLRLLGAIRYRAEGTFLTKRHHRLRLRLSDGGDTAVAFTAEMTQEVSLCHPL